MRVFYVFLLSAVSAAQQQAPVEKPAPSETNPQPQQDGRSVQRTQLNLLGQTNTDGGESRRNENVQFNLIDTNTLRELNLRIGTTATIVSEFRAEASYFGSEYGNPPRRLIHLPEAPRRPALRGNLDYAHNNSIFSARSFFQVGPVKPARENDYGFQLLTNKGRWGGLSLEGRQQKLRGQVNGNVLVPLPSERTPLTLDPAVRPIVERFLAAYPPEYPNRTDIDARALNTNAPQRINTNFANARWDPAAGVGSDKGRFSLFYQFTSQQVDAFQFVHGQNPDTDTHSHTARIHYRRAFSAATLAQFTAGFERVTTHILPEPNAVGPTVSISNFIANLGPAPPIPIIRATNRFRWAGQIARARGNHNWYAGAEAVRHQVNGKDQDVERGLFRFSNDFGRDAITNLRMGTPSIYVQALGNFWRGYRNWSFLLYAGDGWRLSPNLHLDYGLRWEPVTTPIEVNRIDTIPYPCACANLAPRLGFAYRLPGDWGRIRAGYSLDYGEIFATTYSQVRLSPPSSYRVVVSLPDMRDPLRGLSIENLPPNFPSGVFLVSPEMTNPYAHQYNFSWEPGPIHGWRLQLGYVGSRAFKLFQMWFENRARPVPGIPQITATINQRRPDPTRLEVFRLLNSSRGYYDAGRLTLIVPRKGRLSGEISYWFSKALDLGNDYTATLAGVDARQGRSQAEQDVHQDLKGPTIFDQPHALLVRGSIDLPGLSLSNRLGRGLFSGWVFSAVGLIKNGTPFTVESGSDGPGFGNVDGQESDRVHVVDPSVLGRTIGDPDTSFRLLPRSAFAFIQPWESRGNLGRNTFRRGKIANVNASLSRTWKLSGERAAELRAESINFLNTPQFAEPTRELSSPSFAKITNTLNDGRTFRFLLRFRF